MHYTAKVVCVGDHIDTDAIIPARFLLTSDPVELGRHCMEGLDPHWLEKVVPHKTVLVAGKNFGCGSSREHAPVAILGAGIDTVIAHSMARIFYRNAFNTGLLVLEIGDEVSKFNEGDEVEVNRHTACVTNMTTGEMVTFPHLPESMQAILDAGGLVPFVKQRLA